MKIIASKPVERTSLFRMHGRPCCNWCGAERPTDEWVRLTRTSGGFYAQCAPACVACATRLEKAALPEVARFVKESGHA